MCCRTPIGRCPQYRVPFAGLFVVSCAVKGLGSGIGAQFNRAMGLASSYYSILSPVMIER